VESNRLGTAEQELTPSYEIRGENNYRMLKQSIQQGRSERSRLSEVEVKVEQKIRLSSLNLSLSLNLPVKLAEFSASC